MTYLLIALAAIAVFVCLACFPANGEVMRPRRKIPEIKVGTFHAEIRRVYTTNDGLPDDSVLSIAIASGGVVYAATAKGLAKFDRGKWSRASALEGVPQLLASHGSEMIVATGHGVCRVGAEGAARLASLPAEIGGARALRSLVGAETILLGTKAGLFELVDGRVVPVTDLNQLLGEEKDVRQVAVARDGRVAVAAMAGLFIREAAGQWEGVYPRDGGRSWAPYDVRGVAFDSKGRWWFASPQGAGRLEKGEWALYTGYEGLPYDDFTTMAGGENGVVWFGTEIGAIRYDGENWEYRQGPRWLPDDVVRAIAVSEEGDAWFATARGVGLIERKAITLAEKATFFEDEIDKYHRRTPYGYVDTVGLPNPGDKSEWTQHDSDNDGLWTGMYGAGDCFAYAATKDPKAKERAKAAFEALKFLGDVTQGGTHPAPRGFVARSILPTSGRNPNEGRLAADRKRKAENDALWKVTDPRWPVSEDGQWYWKTDTSSDELDGHFFFYGLYYDLVAETEQEKARVREHVGAIADHLIEHEFQLVDHDGLPTRWARYSPKELNFSKDWWEEKGLNSLSVLSYLSLAEHICGTGRYRAAVKTLVNEHGYATNVMYPKNQFGMGSGNQSDDEMAFMSFYNLIKYAEDPELRQVAAKSLKLYWSYIEPEINPLFNFIYAASCNGLVYRGASGIEDLSADNEGWLNESADTLKRFPLDRIAWALKNSHRKDIVRLPGYARGGDVFVRGYRRNGKVLPIDERRVEHWNHDPWALDYRGNGGGLADGAAFLLPYYMGLYHGFIVE